MALWKVTKRIVLERVEKVEAASRQEAIAYLEDEGDMDSPIKSWKITATRRRAGAKGAR